MVTVDPDTATLSPDTKIQTVYSEASVIVRAVLVLICKIVEIRLFYFEAEVAVVWYCFL